MTKSTRTPESTTVVIRNDLTDSERTLTVPVTPQEAESSCLAVRRALEHADGFQALEEYGRPERYDEEVDLAVVVHKVAGGFYIRWWPAATARKPA